MIFKTAVLFGLAIYLAVVGSYGLAVWSVLAAIPGLAGLGLAVLLVFGLIFSEHYWAAAVLAALIIWNLAGNYYLEKKTRNASFPKSEAKSDGGALVIDAPTASHLSVSLAKSRDHWFQMCLAFVVSLGQRDKELKLEIVNTKLQGSGESAVKAYQLEMVAWPYIENHKYLNDSANSEFRNRLAMEVYGDRYSECIDFARWYKEVEQGTGLTRFIFDMIRFLGGVELKRGDTDMELILLAPFMEVLYQPFHLMTYYPLAEAFGDKAMQTRIKDKWREIDLDPELLEV